MHQHNESIHRFPTPSARSGEVQIPLILSSHFSSFSLKQVKTFPKGSTQLMLEGQFEGRAVGHIIDAINDHYKSSKIRALSLARSVRNQPFQKLIVEMCLVVEFFCSLSGDPTGQVI